MLNSYLNSSLLNHNFLGFTRFAFILLFQCLAFSSAFRTLRLSLGQHSHYSYNLHSNTSTFALFTFLWILASFSIALFAYSVSLDLDFFHSSHKYLIESDLHLNELGFHFSWTRIFLIKKTSKAALSIWGSSISDTLLSPLVIKLLFFRVGKHLISLRNSFKPLGITTFVRVLLECLFSKCLSNLINGCFFCNVEEFIVLGSVDLLISLLLVGLLFFGTLTKKHGLLYINSKSN